MSARTRRERDKGLSRRTAVRPEVMTFRVYVEGESTEPEYLRAIARSPEFDGVVAVTVSIERAGAVPMTLVDAACAAKRAGRTEVDQYWCVFDVESPKPKQHPHLVRACDKARANQVHVAISNPCFELWLVLHLRDQTAHLSTDDAVRLRASLDGSRGKHLEPATFVPRWRQASHRARSLRTRHRRDGTVFPEDNPSSSVDLLLAQIEEQVDRARARVGPGLSDPRSSVVP